MEDQFEGHDGEGHSRFDPDEEGEADAEDDKRRDDQGMRPGVNVSTQVLPHCVSVFLEIQLCEK